jgi:hypothetical protein
VSNQDFEGKVPADEASGAPQAPEGTPEYLEQQLAKERDARVLMRDRLRHTEALAAESHALRARMAQELERVTADRDRLRTAGANTPAAGAAAAAAAPSSPPGGVEPQFTPHLMSQMPPPITSRASDGPFKPPGSARSGPWRALAMLGGLAAGVACVAWITGTLPGGSGTEMAAASAAATAAPHVATTSSAAATRSTPSASALALASAAPASATALPPPGGAVALPALTPEQQLAAIPSAAGPAPASAPVAAAAPAAVPAGMSARLRTALDGEGIAAAVDVDAATGHVMVADPQAEQASRDRTDLVIRAVYAGASLPEPQIEHRWMSPKRGERAAPTAAVSPTPVRSAAPAQASGDSTAAAYAGRRAAAGHVAEHRKQTAGATVADAEELRPVLPEGRVTASCRTSVAGKSTPHRADMTACMKHSCCSTSANHQAEDCRAYEKAYPFTCGAG